MNKYTIVYYETYGKVYEVEAKDLGEAKKKLALDICEGRLEGPDECVGSKYDVQKVEVIPE